MCMQSEHSKQQATVPQCHCVVSAQRRTKLIPLQQHYALTMHNALLHVKEALPWLLLNQPNTGAVMLGIVAISV